MGGTALGKRRSFSLPVFSSRGFAGWLPPRTPGAGIPAAFFDPVAVNEPFLSQAIDRIDRVVDEAGEGGRLGPSQIFLVGFSQGACLALEYALRRPGRSGALVVFTGSIFGAPGEVRGRFRQTCWPACACL